MASSDNPTAWTFPSLPAETLAEIIDLANINDQKAWSLVSKFCHSQARKRLFATFNVYGNDKDFTIAPPIPSRIRESLEASRPLRLLYFVRHMHFLARVHHRLAPGERCGSMKIPYAGRKAWFWDEGPNGKMVSTDQLLKRLPEDSLRTFGWELATCIPVGLLGPGSPLVTRQRALKSLSIKTFPCLSGHERERLVLTSFRQVRKFSWIGLMAVPDLESVRDFLKANREILETLELDFLKWEQVEQNWRRHHGIDSITENIFARHILPIGLDDTNQQFTSLRNLSLSQVPFSNALTEIASTFDFSQLRSLTLRCCANTPQFLHALVIAKTSITLSKLEISMRDGQARNWSDSALNMFLKSFHGLQELYILVDPEGYAFDDYWQSLTNHITTLRSFLYHERRWLWDDCHVDQWTGQMISYYMREEWRRADGLDEDIEGCRLLWNQNIDCFGTCDHPIMLRKRMQGLEHGPGSFGFKLIHIRYSQRFRED